MKKNFCANLVLINNDLGQVENNQFMENVINVATNNGFEAKVFKAIIVNNKKDNEYYGAVLNVNADSIQEMVELATILKEVFSQDHVLIQSDAESLPIEFVEGRRCSFETKGTLYSKALEFHGRLRSCGNENHPTRVSIVAWQDGEVVRFQSLYNPNKAVNPMVWQKNAYGILQKTGIKPVITPTAIAVV